MEGVVCSNSVSLESFLSSFMEAVVLETAIAASKALALSLHMNNFFPTCLIIEQKLAFFSYQIGSLSDGSSVLPEESGTSPGFPLTELLPKKKSDPDNQDGSDTEDDQDDEDEDGQDDQDDDEGEEDEPGKDNEDSEDPEDEPEANGDGGSEDDDEDDDDDDDEEDEDDDEEEDEDEDEDEDEEDIPQPPYKKRK
uniref:Uncharacterized protein n=1 Tax=Salix viminalis TaxID=40686 RepID=A0A6N2KF98_SALVM